MSTKTLNRHRVRESRVGRVDGKLALSGKDRGFTIIELLVVMAIIGLLAAIAIPVFSKLKNNAYDSAAQSDLRQAALATESNFTVTNSYPANDAAFSAVGGIELGLKLTTASKENLEYKYTAPNFSISLYDTRTYTVFCYQSGQGGMKNLGVFTSATIATGILGCAP